MAAIDAVHDAIERWRERGLVDDALAGRLREEAVEHEGRSERRWAQYALAITGAIVLIIAAGVFLDWAWPVMGAGARAVLLAVVGGLLIALGIYMESRDRYIPVSYLLQTAGLVVLLIACGYSGQAWVDGSAGGIVVGLLALVTPLVLASLSIQRNPVMPAVHTALGYAFLFMFLDRSTTLSTDTNIWILDGVLLVSTLILVFRLRAAARSGDPPAWLLNAFVASVYAGLILVFATAAGPLDLRDDAAYAMDLWLIVATALTLWGIHAAPPGLHRAWYGRQLALCVLLGTGFAWWTMLGALDADETIASVAVALFGGVGLAYGLRLEAREVIVASCLGILSAAWFFGVEKGSAIGAVLALAFSAALFFWLSTRVDREAARD